MKILQGLKSLICCVLLASQLSFADDPVPSAVNINTANAETLALVLNGVGDVRARSIVAWRDKNGPFTSAEQLLDVRGVGTALLEQNRDRILLE